MPLAKNGTRRLRYFRQMRKAPKIRKAPTTESTVLKVMTRVRLLPRPDMPSLDESVGFRISVAVGAEELEEVCISDGIAVTRVSVPAEVAAGRVSIVVAKGAEVGCMVENGGGIDLVVDITTGVVVVEGPEEVVEIPEVVTGGAGVSGVVVGSGQNVQLEVGRPLPSGPGPRAGPAPPSSFPSSRIARIIARPADGRGSKHVATSTRHFAETMIPCTQAAQ